METQTIVSNGTMSLDALDQFPGVEAKNVLTTAPSIFSTNSDLSFLDKPGAVKLDPAPNDKKDDKGTDTPAPGADVTPVSTVEADKILNSIGKDEVVVDDNTAIAGDDDTKKTGRDGITSYLKAKIESGDFQAFEDFDEKKETLEQYLSKQPVKALHQMLDANWDAKKAELLEQTPKEFFEALPEELQAAAKYVMNGGTDMKGLFAALSRIEQIKATDISTEDGQITTARSYLQAIQFGTPEEIEDEVNAWKDGNRLEKKAKEIKPKLDAMQKEQIEYQTQQAAAFQKQQHVAAQAYIGNIQKAFEKGDINGIKLDKKTAGTLYQGLTTLQYPSAAGQPTNLLGHLIDKIQYVEPDFALLVEATYLLSDPVAYRNSIKQLGKNEQVIDTVKKLKSEQQTSGAGGSEMEDDNQGGTKTVKKLSKPRSVLDGWK